MLFYGLMESRSEKCASKVNQFIVNELDLDEPFPVERAHRLGPLKAGRGQRPIIAALSSYRGVELIMSHAHLLAGKRYSVRDFIKEIMMARKVLWSKYKEVKNNSPAARVSIPGQTNCKWICYVRYVPGTGAPWSVVIALTRKNISELNGLISVCSPKLI